MANSVRIELFVKIHKKYWFYFSRFSTEIIQGKPFTLYIKVTNIGNSPSPDFNVTNFELNAKQDNIIFNTKNTITIVQLNPNESVVVELDKFTIGCKGSAWASLSLEPTVPTAAIQIQTYQHDLNHKKDEAYLEVNAWGDLLYVQGELEIIQQKTNNLILLLTTVTVIQSIWGTKEFIKFVYLLLSTPILQIINFFITTTK